MTGGNEGSGTIRLAIVEDHPAIAQGLGRLLASAPDVEVVTVTDDPAGIDALIEGPEGTRPDVVLCDVMLGGRDRGFELLERHFAEARFLMFSAYEFPAHHRRAVEEGAAGFVSKLASADEILHAIRQVHAGGSMFSVEVLRSARRAPRNPSDRELELLRLLAEGASNEAIGARLRIRPKTVEGMLRRLFDRYVVENRTQLARFAMRQGWLTADPPAGEVPPEG